MELNVTILEQKLKIEFLDYSYEHMDLIILSTLIFFNPILISLFFFLQLISWCVCVFIGYATNYTN